MRVKNVPVINIAQLERPATLAALDEACRSWGFFQVIGHGIDTALFAALLRATRAFFAQATAAKRAISRTAVNPWGFYDRELTKNTRDWKEIFDYGPTADGLVTPQWPAAMPGFQRAVVAYYVACEQLAFRLLRAISVNLNMPADHLNRGFSAAHSSFVRLNYYPACPTPAHPDGVDTPVRGHLGVNHHTDARALTLLLQDAQPGLEVFREDRWHLVEPRADALVVNIGDIVQVWSNDRYRASLHRVMANAHAARCSAPFFFNPSYSTNDAPLPTTVTEREPARYRLINWGEFRAQRPAGDYADCGKEVQISDSAQRGWDSHHRRKSDVGRVSIEGRRS